MKDQHTFKKYLRYFPPELEHQALHVWLRKNRWRFLLHFQIRAWSLHIWTLGSILISFSSGFLFSSGFSSNSGCLSSSGCSSGSGCSSSSGPSINSGSSNSAFSSNSDFLLNSDYDITQSPWHKYIIVVSFDIVTPIRIHKNLLEFNSFFFVCCFLFFVFDCTRFLIRYSWRMIISHFTVNSFVFIHETGSEPLYQGWPSFSRKNEQCVEIRALATVQRNNDWIDRLPIYEKYDWIYRSLCPPSFHKGCLLLDAPIYLSSHAIP